MGTRVLVVEDDEMIARAYTRLLTARGFEVVVAGTVAGAIGELESASMGAPFDHVVLDIRLPDGDGENVLAFAEGLPRPPGVVVVAAPMGLDARRFSSLQGRCMYLPKPIVIDTLIEAFDRRPDAMIGQYCILHDFSDQEAATFERAIEDFDDDGIALEIGCKATTVRTYWNRIGEKTGTSGKDQTLTHFARWLLARAVGSQHRRPTPAPESRRNVVPMSRRA